jgi:acyl-CoA synthetase (AMP-forming)/AMP-acid ligase II/acyl carrier protein
MGLIGNMLHAIYAGCTCIVMNPVSFMQRPRRWLEAITQYKVTHSGGPNFAYDLCTEKISKADLSGLNLSSWRIAYNGAEPVKAATMQLFSERFKTVGFDPASFYPCYGLAEATLLVAGSKKRQPPVTINIKAQQPIVSCGQVARGMHVLLHTEKEEVTGDLQEGEICIAGESVTEGYWKKNNDHLFYTLGGRRYLRTGDTGFFYNNELFILGRIKELIIVRGRNIDPADLEQIAAACNNHIEPNGVAAFAIAEEGGSFALLVEIKRTSLQQANLQTLVSHLDTEIANAIGIRPYDIVLTTPRQIPRTTSGKIQRLACQAMYASNETAAIASKRNRQQPASHQNERLLEAVKQKGDAHSVRQYLEATISEKLGVPVNDSLHQLNDLAAIGLDSIGAIEMVHKVNRDLQLNLDASVLFREHTLNDLVTTIERLLWLKNKKNTGKEIMI